MRIVAETTRRIVQSTSANTFVSPGITLAAILLTSIPLAVCHSAESQAAKKLPHDQAAKIVRDALASEARLPEGVPASVKEDNSLTSTNRYEQMRLAVEQDPDYAPARWQSGFVRLGNDWVDYESIPELMGKRRSWIVYQKTRSKYPLTAQGQWQLATWCGDHNLPGQQRAHAHQVILLEPDHQAARQLLGFVRVDGQWLSQQEIRDRDWEARVRRENLRQWTPVLQKIVKGLNSRNLKRREAARKELEAISDPTAIAALEQILIPLGEEGTLTATRLIGNMAQVVATQWLAKYAVFSPWKSVRELATTQLKGREYVDYVPEYLAAMRVPMESRFQVALSPNGQIVYRHTSMREGQNERQVSVTDSTYKRIRLFGSDWRETYSRTLRGINDIVAERNQKTVAAAQQDRVFNNRMASVLRETTQEKLADNPQEWWAWWYKYNHLEPTQGKAVSTRYGQNKQYVVDKIYAYETPDGRYEYSGEQMPFYYRRKADERRYAVELQAQRYSEFLQTLPITDPRRQLHLCSCLAAGTQVWTATGATAIDKVEVGDLVLSKNPDSGELAYKPVIATTIRKARPLVRLGVAGDTIVSTLGHRFWVSGQGWKMTEEIQPGDSIHAARDTSTIVTKEKGPNEPTYNLVVEDFHTYFVGPKRIFSHDVTIPEPTNAIVPGLLRVATK